MTKPLTEANKVAKQIGKSSYKENIAIIAEAIAVTSKSIRELNGSQLKRRAVLLLIRDQTNMGIGDIEAVLNAAARLDTEYLKPKS